MLNRQNQNEMPVNVVGGSVFGRYPKISSEVTYNMYISNDWLVSYAGWKKVIEFFVNVKAQGRGIFKSSRNNILVAVVNSTVYKITSGFSITFIGNLATSLGPVFIDENLANQICLVDKLDAYIYNYDLGSITRQNLGGILIPNYVCYHNTFFLLGNGDVSNDGAKWFVFRVDTPTTISVETELSLETKPDYAIAVIRIPGGSDNILVFGNTVAELWTEVGGEENYQRNSTLNIDIGCISVATIAWSDQYVMWLGVNEYNSPCIMILAGNKAEAISTDGIDYVLGQLKYPQQSTAFFKKEDGHLFYQITFYNPDDNLSLFYDIETKKFFNTSDADLNFHPARKMVYFNNDLYFININNGCIYKSNTNLTTYDENIDGRLPNLIKEIPRIRTCDSLRQPNSMPFRSRNLIVTIDQGNDELVQNANVIPDDNLIITQGGIVIVTQNYEEISIQKRSRFIDYVVAQDDVIMLTQTGDIIVTQNSNDDYQDEFFLYRPRVDLTFSIDGGRTFSNTVGVYLHSVGNRKNMLRWSNQFGQANDLIFKFHFWGKSYWCVNNGVVNIY